MKSIEQLIALRDNPYYSFTPEEQKVLNDFLSKKSEQTDQQQSSNDSSESSTRATVRNKNIVAKETGDIPTVDNVATPDVNI